MTETLLAVQGLSVEFGARAQPYRAVKSLDFTIGRGETVALVGESGSGKSVTALSILRLIERAGGRIASGSARFVPRDGREVDLFGLEESALRRIRGNEIAMIFQDPLSSLTPVFTVGAQIVEALAAHQRIGSRQAWDRAVELLELVGIPDPVRRAKAYPHELSGGMRQRVMIAMAMANDPAVIVADEPTTALDVTIQAQILDLLATAQRETGAAVLLITHDLGVVAGTADDVVVMYAGRPVEQADVDTLFREPRMPYTIGLLGAVPRVDRRVDALVPIPGSPPVLIDPPDQCMFAPRCPIAMDECRSAEPALHDAGGPRGHSADEHTAAAHTAACVRSAEIVGNGVLVDAAGAQRPVYPEPEVVARAEVVSVPRAQRDIVLDVAGMTKLFPLTSGLLKRRIGTVRAVRGVSFDIRAGESLAIVGESGSGKSTTLLEVMDFAQPAGVVRIGGVDPAAVRKRAARALRQDVSIVFQDPAEALDPRFTAFDIIAEPLRALGVPRSEAAQKVTDLLARVGLDPVHSDRFPAAFSGGQRQRLAIARALATDPSLIILDEPLSALDVSVQAEIVNLIRRLQSTGDVAYLVVAHDLSVIRHLADRVAVMYLGEFVEVGETEQVFDAPAHPYTKALLSAVPIPDPAAERARTPIVLRGEQPSPTDDIVGCCFTGRCPLYVTLDPERQSRCRSVHPELRAIGPADDHVASCHYLEVDA